MYHLSPDVECLSFASANKNRSLKTDLPNDNTPGFLTPIGKKTTIFSQEIRDAMNHRLAGSVYYLWSPKSSGKIDETA